MAGKSYQSFRDDGAPEPADQSGRTLRGSDWIAGSSARKGAPQTMTRQNDLSGVAPETLVPATDPQRVARWSRRNYDAALFGRVPSWPSRTLIGTGQLVACDGPEVWPEVPRSVAAADSSEHGDIPSGNADNRRRSFGIALRQNTRTPDERQQQCRGRPTKQRSIIPVMA